MVSPARSISSCKDFGRQRLCRGVGRIEDDEAAWSQNALQPARERVRHSGARLITAAKVVEKCRRELRCWQRRLQVGDRGVDRFVQLHARDGSRMCARRVSPNATDRGAFSVSITPHDFTSSQS